MKGIVSQFVLSIFLIILMWIGVSYVSQNMQYSSARDYYHLVVRQMENSDFDQAVVKACEADAKKRGYRLQIRQYGENQRDARIILEFDYRFPMTQQKKQYVVDGYAR